MKTTVYIATSLDGFIAREDGRLDWLPGADGEAPESDSPEDYGYSHYVGDVDAIVMGRNTYETVLGFGEWPYKQRVVVLSNSLMAENSQLPAGVSIMSGAPADIIKQLAAEGATHLYIDGGQTIQTFLRAGQLDELIITRIPVLLGSGIALFGALDEDVWLAHVKTAAFPNGFVQSHYRIER